MGEDGDYRMQVRAGLLGAAVGDALGVPVEFTTRSMRREDPVEGMRGFGTWDQEPGTWSDDTSIMMCQAESLVQGYDPTDFAIRFVKWVDESYWAPRGERFDIGNTTMRAADRFKDGSPALDAGPDGDRYLGNGSLMRILPMVYFSREMDIEETYRKCHEMSRVTHGHPACQMACAMYVDIGRSLLAGSPLTVAIDVMRTNVVSMYSDDPYASEMERFSRVLDGSLGFLSEDTIHSSGYVIHALEASLWCLLTSVSYAETVLKAVNMGDDTDTTACIAGGLAGILYGIEEIPEEWLEVLARREDIERLADELADVTQ